MSDEEKTTKKKSPIVKIAVIVLVVALVAAVASTGGKKSSDDTDQSENDSTAAEDSAPKNDGMDALRKCTVMEAADIYSTGIGKKSNNVFNDARETCQSWWSSWGDEEFFKAVSGDWETRQNEEIDGHPLTYYLDILGW